MLKGILAQISPAATSLEDGYVVPSLRVATIQQIIICNRASSALAAGGSLILQSPYIETNAIFAIREGGFSSTVFAQETT